MPALRNVFQVVKTGIVPTFSGVYGQIDHRTYGAKIDEAGALRVAAVWIAASTIADEVASLAMKIVLRDDATRTPQQPPQLRALWGDPNPDQTRFGVEWTEALSMTLWGASYTYLGWTNAGALDVRWPINPAGVRLERLDDGGMKLISAGQGELYNRNGQRPEFEYIPRYQMAGDINPVSPVEKAAELLGLAKAYEQTASKFMTRGLNPSALLLSEERMPGEEARELSERISALYGGANNAGKVAVIGGKGVKLERMTMSMADAEFVAQNDRVFDVLMAIWKVPPTVAGMVNKPSTWGTGVAEFARGLERFTLRPIVLDRQAAHEKFITRWVNPNLQVRYVFDSLLSASPRDRVEIQRSRLLAGMTSIERIQAQEDEPPFNPDETVYSQLAMSTGEDRALTRLKTRADIYATLVKAGVDATTAAQIAQFDAEEAALLGQANA